MAKDKSLDEKKAETVDKEIDALVEQAPVGADTHTETKMNKTADTVVEETTDGDEAMVTGVEQAVTKRTAKAGKRSEKAIKEAEEKQAKEERKAAAAEDEAADKPKQKQNPARSRLERRGKNYRKLHELVEKDKQYTLEQAIELATKTNPAKFDASVEMHINLGVDPRQADQNIRATIVLPAGTGRTVRVAALTDDTAAATKAGADIAGVDELLGAIEKGEINFDILIAAPNQMAKLGKYARTLGPKGLMPNPKSGTVTTDIAKAVREAKAGRVEYRVDSTGIVHMSIGKVSFGTDKLMDNARAVMASVRSNKPASIKGSYISAIHVSTTMGPGIKVAPNEA